MLISENDLMSVLANHGICVKGVLHIGAHECEELPFYTRLGVPAEKIVWIDALPTKVQQATDRGIPNVYHAVVTDKDNDTVVFNVSNNGQSSSVLEFGLHSHYHSWVHWVGKIEQKTTTIDTFFTKNKLDPSEYNFWNMDIQGAELLALKGAKSSLQWPDVLYLEVNEAEVYRGCGLVGQIDELLSAQGFQRVMTKMTDAKWGDAVYIRSSSFKNISTQ